MTQRTALYAIHLALGAKVIDFGGWDMPVEYPTHIIQEHLATRTAAGLFDTAHMGELLIEGPGAFDSLQRMLTRDLTGMEIGQGRYTLLPSERGTVLDDLVVFKWGEQSYYIVTNAGTFDADREHLQAHLKNATLKNLQPETHKLDLQGPRTFDVLAKLCPAPVHKLKRFRLTTAPVAGVDCIVSKSGYTGEAKGVELFFPKSAAEKIWTAILDAGRPWGVLPCGLGARDTLRLEACLPLYGHELSTEITPLEAGLDWAVALEKEFLGVDALRRQKAAGLPRVLVALKLSGRQPGRAQAPVFQAAKPVGVVTSGTFGPSVGCAIALALVEPGVSAPGSALQIEVRGTRLEAQVVEKPFYPAR